MPLNVLGLFACYDFVRYYFDLTIVHYPVVSNLRIRRIYERIDVFFRYFCYTEALRTGVLMSVRIRCGLVLNLFGFYVFSEVVVVFS
mgnify:CR=1 FL=1